jgi:hypothetical protein
MQRVFKIGLSFLLVSGGCCIVLLFLFVRSIERTASAGELDRQVQLANSAVLRVHRTPTMGPDSGYSWDISYRDQARWEKTGGWWGNDDGNVLACTAGRVVVVTRTNGAEVFSRTATGTWKAFLMDIPGPWFLGKNGELSPNTTSLEMSELESIRRQMSVTPGDGEIRPYLGQFLPQREELWIDYLTPERRRFRLKLRISKDAERFHLLSVEEKAFDRNRPFFEQLVPDQPVDAACKRIES